MSVTFPPEWGLLPEMMGNPAALRSGEWKRPPREPRSAPPRPTECLAGRRHHLSDRGEPREHVLACRPAKYFPLPARWTADPGAGLLIQALDC